MQTMINHLILASFIPKDTLTSFYHYLNTNFGISKNGVFVYEQLNDSPMVICTFRILKVDGQRFEIRNVKPNAVQVHKNGSTLYTINALNKLIELETGEPKELRKYSKHRIVWSNYANKLVLTQNDELIFLPINRLF